MTEQYGSCFMNFDGNVIRGSVTSGEVLAMSASVDAADPARAGFRYAIDLPRPALLVLQANGEHRPRRFALTN